ncbi:hypothetical protein KIPB_008901 [Kipferlia bialata]|uniref:Uncharacterized protein n=1 Tax=Kipferlia bialata TaxID=797122 RepID=A0A391NNV5_9EUKA|nr:hypothetical protein KIPB_008901 [Kipferlia bialata]|eukprot:g8901.t1
MSPTGDQTLDWDHCKRVIDTVLPAVLAQPETVSADECSALRQLVAVLEKRQSAGTGDAEPNTSTEEACDSSADSACAQEASGGTPVEGYRGAIQETFSFPMFWQGVQFNTFQELFDVSKYPLVACPPSTSAYEVEQLTLWKPYKESKRLGEALALMVGFYSGNDAAEKVGLGTWGLFQDAHIGLKAVEAGYGKGGGWRVEWRGGEAVSVLGNSPGELYGKIQQMDAELGMDSRQVAEVALHWAGGNPYRAHAFGRDEEILVGTVQEQWSLLERVRSHTLPPFYPFKDAFNSMWARFEGVDKDSLSEMPDSDVDTFLVRSQ